MEVTKELSVYLRDVSRLCRVVVFLMLLSDGYHDVLCGDLTDRAQL